MAGEVFTEIECKDHTGCAEELLPKQYKCSPRLIALIEALLGEITCLEEGLCTLKDAFDCDTATGDFLDIAGELEGVPRRGLDDEHYRRLIKASRLCKRGCGTRDDILAVLEAYVGQAPSVLVPYNIIDLFGSTCITVEEFSPLVQKDILFDLLSCCMPAGVYWTLKSDEPNAFCFSSIPDQPEPSPDGWDGGCLVEECGPNPYENLRPLRNC